MQGYPTIIFIPGNNKKNVKAYAGARTEKGMIEYIKEMRTTKAWNKVVQWGRGRGEEVEGKRGGGGDRKSRKK